MPGKKTNFNIVNTYDGDREYLENLCRQNRRPDGSKQVMPWALNQVILAHKNQGKPAGESAPIINPEDHQNLINQNADLQTQIIALTEQLEAAKLRVKQLENVQPTPPEPEPIKPPAFLFVPQGQTLALMRRYFSFMRKQNKIRGNEPDLPQQLTDKSILYYIKNEYPEVLK